MHACIYVYMYIQNTYMQRLCKHNHVHVSTNTADTHLLYNLKSMIPQLEKAMLFFASFDARQHLKDSKHGRDKAALKIPTMCVCNLPLHINQPLSQHTSQRAPQTCSNFREVTRVK